MPERKIFSTVDLTEQDENFSLDPKKPLTVLRSSLNFDILLQHLHPMHQTENSSFMAHSVIFVLCLD